MNIQEAKNIVLAEYLQSLGIAPCKKQGSSLWYKSPFREETEPSFKVNLARNEWYDFGAGMGGNILDFVMEYNGTDSVPHVLKIIAGQVSAGTSAAGSFSFRPQTSLPAFEEIHIDTLSNPALIQYLKERNINIAFAVQICREVHFTANGKRYFTIGFENDMGGYELRNRYFKGCLSPKGITTIDNDSDTVMVFEGFMDFLSYLTLKNNGQPRIDTVILNSVANLKKAIPFIESHRTIHSFFDNDEAGRKTASEIIRLFPTAEVIDQSHFYRDYKDLNDCLKNRFPVREKSMKRGRRL